MRIHKTAPTILIALLFTIGPRLLVAGDQCAQTSSMNVYSSAYVSKETGDLNGFELAFKQDAGAGVDALLFVYEGAPSDGIPLQGHISGNKLLVNGNWEEHLIEYPSKKETVENHAVKIEGTFDVSHFHGKISINGLGDVDKVVLKYVRQVWMCRGR
jgi:hypothetical protein